MSEINQPYWLEVPAIKGELTPPPPHASIVIIGSGLSGVSAGYFLQKHGLEDLLILDYRTEDSATYRNCGHILHGTVESMKAFSEIHGIEKAKELWQFSVDICQMVQSTISELDIKADYRKDGYLVIAVDKSEEMECKESIQLLNSAGFHSEYIDSNEIQKLGFKNCLGARYERGSAQAHPVKFRNGVLQEYLNKKGKYHSDVKVTKLEDSPNGVLVTTEKGTIQADAVVIAANAYAPLFSEFFKSRKLIEPFRGQIITSKPLRHEFKVKFPHSFDHGYEYALITEDNRIMIGGWRNHSPTKEVGTYSIATNPMITEGLKQFARDHYQINEEIQWQYSWAGIMGASQTSLPFIGPTNSDRIYACAGYTGHGFSWAHGSAALLAKIIAGDNVPGIAKYFNPKTATLK